MRFDGYFIRDHSKNAKRGSPGYNVGHTSLATFYRFEFVGVSKRFEGTARQFIDEAVRGFKLGDAGAESLFDAKVTAFEGHLIAEFKEPFCFARYDAFAGFTRGFDVEGSIAGEVEAVLDGCIDLDG